MGRIAAGLLALLLTAACGDTVATGGSATATPTVDVAPAPPGCPDRFPAPRDRAATSPWVPSEPTTETPGRLVPDADPVAAVVCRYDVGDFPEPEGVEPPLAGEVALTAGLDRIRHDLLLPEQRPGQDRACTLIGAALVPHLLRLDYADGSLWVSALTDANSCTRSGNGVFVTSAYLGGQLSQSYDAARWVVPPEQPAGSCLAGGRGRAGQEVELVPAGWTSLSLCRPAAGGTPPPPAREVDRTTADRVVEVLSAVETGPGGNTCHGPYDEAYELLFAYPQGPSVQVAFSPGCVPEVRNGSLDGLPAPAQTATLRRLLGGP